MKPSSQMQSVSCYFAVLSFIIAGVDDVSAQCEWLSVSGSEFSSQTGLNGQYQFFSTVICNYQYIWVEQDSTPSPNYIYYDIDLVESNGSEVIQGWAIGSDACHSLVYAKNTAGFNEFPYNLPNGTWQEFNPNTGSFVNNPNLAITCSSYLSTGAIIGVVFGSIAAAILLLSLLGLLCRHHQMKRLRQTTAAATAAQQAVEMPVISGTTYSQMYQNTVYYPYAAASNPVDLTYSTIVQPPMYDNQQPPEYAAVGEAK